MRPTMALSHKVRPAFQHLVVALRNDALLVVGRGGRRITPAPALAGRLQPTPSSLAASV